MNEQDLAEHFSGDVESVLTRIDFSTESQVRRSLRQRLLGQMNARGERQAQKGYSARILGGRLRPAAILAMFVALAVFMLTFVAGPGVLTAAAQEVVDFIQSLWVSEYTSIHQVAPGGPLVSEQGLPSAFPVVEQRGDLWIVRTSIGNFADNELPGQSGVQHFHALDEVQASVPYRLRLPAYLPEGYTFREAILTPLGRTILFYNGPDGDLVVAQIYVGRQTDSEPASSIAVGTGMLTDKPIETVALNGQQAGWIAGTGLMWENDGVSYLVGGVRLSLENAIRVAESLE